MMRTLGAAILVCASAAAQEENVREARRPGTYTKILTPTQIDAWTLEGAAGETVVAHVRSEEFDPVLELVDANNRELKRVDDPGNESRFAADLPARGTYKVRVRGFQDRAGGPYALTIERFTAAPIETDRPATGVLGPDGTGHHRLITAKGQILLPRVTPGSVSLQRVHDPEGRPIAAGKTGLESMRDGGHYLSYRGQPGARYTVTVGLARFSDLPPEATTRGALREGEMHVLRFTREAGQFTVFETTSTAPLDAQLIHAPEEADARRGLIAATPVEPVRVLSGLQKAGTRRLAVQFGRTGRYQLRLMGVAEYALRASDPTVRLAPGDERAADLAVGGAAFFAFETKAPRLLQIDLSSERFDPVLQLFDAAGRLLETNDDLGGSLSSRVTLLARVEGPYRIQVGSAGNGGGGAFRLKVEEKKILPLRVGERGRGTLTAGTSELWTLDGRKDQLLLLTARSKECDVALRVLDREGVEIAADDNSGLDTDSLVALRFPHDGACTVQVSSQRGNGAYILRAVED